MKKLFVRVLNKSAAQTFIRCGIKFTRDWKEVTVDAATEARLQAEQMLEVRDTDPNAAPAPAQAQAQALPTVKELVAVAAAALLSETPPQLPGLPEESHEDLVPVAATDPVVAQADQADQQADTSSAPKPKKGSK